MAEQAAPVEPTFDPTPEPAAPAPSAPPEAGSPATPASTPDKPWAGSPWASDLEAAGFDPETAAKVHELWQGKVQPYVTQREQELGEVGEIWAAFNEDETALPTYLALAEQRFGPEVAQHLANSLAEYIGADDPEGGTEVEPSWEDPEVYAAWYEQQPPWVQAQEDQRIANEQDAIYMSEVQRDAPDVIADGTEHIFARYVAGTEDGNVAQAKQWYDQEFGPIVAQAKADPAFAQQVGLGHLHEGAPAAPAPAEAPNVLGSYATPGGSEPPTEPQYASLDAAMDDLFEAVRGDAALHPPGR